MFGTDSGWGFGMGLGMWIFWIHRPPGKETDSSRADTSNRNFAFFRQILLSC